MTKTLEQFISPINGEIKVEKMLGFGTVIRAGNLTQSGGILLSIWKKSLRKVYRSNQKVSTALILGLGGGSLVQVIHKFWPDAQIIGIDIDPLMVEMGKKYLNLDEEEVDIIISDATKFCKKQLKAGKKYDLICIDMYNGDIFPPQFEEDSFLRLILRLLTPSGVAVLNRLYYGEKRKEAVKFSAKLSKVFKQNEAVYPEANVMFVCRK